MKIFLTSIFILLFFASCEKPIDCIKSSGPTTSKTIEIVRFDKIIVNRGIALVISQGDRYTVQVNTGENLIDDIEVKVSNNTLTLEDNTTCNWVRDYGETIIYITAPNLTDIYSKTEKNISSNGFLTYPNLHLVSMDNYDGYKGVGTGDYILQLDCENLRVENNTVSRYFISGKTNQMSVNFYEYGGIFHGENLLANTITLYHRGSNDMVLHPVESIKGDIYNVGNVICGSTPATVEVAEHYRGKLIFN